MTRNAMVTTYRYAMSPERRSCLTEYHVQERRKLPLSVGPKKFGGFVVVGVRGVEFCGEEFPD